MPFRATSVTIVFKRLQFVLWQKTTFLLISFSLSINSFCFIRCHLEFMIHVSGTMLTCFQIFNDFYEVNYTHVVYFHKPCKRNKYIQVTNILRSVKPLIGV
jgi:hypothetical protein